MPRRLASSDPDRFNKPLPYFTTYLTATARICRTLTGFRGVVVMIEKAGVKRKINLRPFPRPNQEFGLPNLKSFQFLIY